jgi:hypothetical protein
MMLTVYGVRGIYKPSKGCWTDGTMMLELAGLSGDQSWIYLPMLWIDVLGMSVLAGFISFVWLTGVCGFPWLSLRLSEVSLV